MKVASLFHPDDIGIYVGLAGIFLAWFFYVRSKERVRPHASIETTSILGRSVNLLPDPVEIRYDDKVVPVLSKVRIAFWNAGTKTLNRSDVAEHDPIRFKFPQTDVLDIRSVTGTREVINASAILKDGEIVLSFDFLDQNDGLALEAFYSSESETEIALNGTIKGVRKGVKISARGQFASSAYPFESPITWLLLMSISSFALFLVAVITAVTDPGKINLFGIVFCSTTSCAGIVFLVSYLYLFLHARMPRRLRES